MSDDSWRDSVVGARMTVDRAFEDRVTQSSFSRQQWRLLMTAVEFEIAHPTDPERAHLVANTDHLDDILPELDAVEEQMSGLGPGGDGGGNRSQGSSGGGVLGTIRNALGFGSNQSVSDDESRRKEATDLLEAYAREFQSHLEAEGRWEEVRSMAADER